MRFGIFHRATDLRAAQVTSVAELRAFNIGSYLGDGYSREQLGADFLHYAKDEESIFRMIDAGRLDIYVQSELVGKHKLREMGMTDKFTFTPASFLPDVNFCFGIRRTYPDAHTIVRKIDEAVQTVRKSGALQALLSRYEQAI